MDICFVSGDKKSCLDPSLIACFYEDIGLKSANGERHRQVRINHTFTLQVYTGISYALDSNQFYVILSQLENQFVGFTQTLEYGGTSHLQRYYVNPTYVRELPTPKISAVSKKTLCLETWHLLKLYNDTNGSSIELALNTGGLLEFRRQYHSQLRTTSD